MTLSPENKRFLLKKVVHWVVNGKYICNPRGIPTSGKVALKKEDVTCTLCLRLLRNQACNVRQTQ
jgi:hypothetical protein